MLPDISNLSEEDLKKLIQKAESLIASHQEQRKKDAAQKIRELAESAGLSVEISASEKAKRTRRKLPPKYRHPDDPEKTWSGIGAKPKWLRAFEQQGRKLEEFKI